MPPALTVTVDRFEGEQAVLRLPGGQDLVVERALLPAGSHEGAVLNLQFTGAPDTEADRAATARQLLTEILHGHE